MELEKSIDYFLASMKGVSSPETIKWYSNRLPSLLAFMTRAGILNAEEVTIMELRLWRSSLVDKTTRYVGHPTRRTKAGGYSLWTLHTYVRSARRLFKWLCEEEIIPTNPARRLELPVLPKRKPRGISVISRDRMIHGALSLRDRSIVLLFADTACRLGGIAHLTLDDLDMEDCSALVREKGRGGYKERTIRFLEPTRDLIASYIKYERLSFPGVRAVFVHNRFGHFGKTAGGLTESGIYQIVRRIALRVGIPPPFNPHAFRHGAIRAWLNAGMPLPDAAQLAGHSSVKTTGDIYGYASEKEIRENHRKFSWMAKKPEDTSERL